MRSALFSVNLAALLLYMSIWFAIGKRQNRLDVADTAWGGGFIIVASLSLLAHSNSRTLLVWAMVICWGLRLATHIWRRNSNKGPDPRYAALSATWSKKQFWSKAYVSIFVTQACLIFLVALPITIVAVEGNRSLGERDILAFGLWVLGFVIEARADWQLERFKQRSDNRGKVMRAGLWKFSRHPNYFGELVQWWAISLLAIGPVIGWVALGGPLLLSYLIIYVSGIPPIEKRYRKKAEFIVYKKTTSMLVPLPRRNHKR